MWLIAIHQNWEFDWVVVGSRITSLGMVYDINQDRGAATVLIDSGSTKGIKLHTCFWYWKKASLHWPVKLCSVSQDGRRNSIPHCR